MIAALAATALAAWPTDALYFTTQPGQLYRVDLTRDGDGTPSAAGPAVLLATPGSGASNGIVFSEGRMLVSSSATGKVLAYDDTLAASDFATGFAADPLFGLAALAVARDGGVFAAHGLSGNGFVAHIPAAGGVAPFPLALDGAAGDVQVPLALAVHPVTGELFAASFNDSTLRAWDPSTGEVRVAATGLAAAAGLVLECDGTVLAAEHFTRRVVTIDLDTNAETLLFTTAANPEQIAIDAFGWRYVGLNNGQILAFDASGAPFQLLSTGLDVDGMTWHDGVSDTSLAASCPPPEPPCPHGPDAELCAAVEEGIQAIEAVYPGVVSQSSATARFRPTSIYARLDAMLQAAEGNGCDTRPLGVTAAGRYRDLLVDGSADGAPFVGTYAAGHADGTFASSTVDGTYRSNGNVRTRVDGTSSLTGIWVRVSGSRGFWLTVETTCDASDFNGWY